MRFRSPTTPDESSQHPGCARPPHALRRGARGHRGHADGPHDQPSRGCAAHGCGTGRSPWFVGTSAILLAGTFAGCAAAATKSPDETLGVFVSIPPQKYVVERIGGDHVRVSVILARGRSPATYEPSPRQLADLARADVYFTIGVPFERFLASKMVSAFPQLRTVDTRAGIVPMPTAAPHAHNVRRSKPQQLHEESQHENDIDPHVWMDPRLVRAQAETVCAELERMDPAHEDDFRTNLASVERDLVRLDRELRKRLAPHKGEAFLVFHPCLGYFAKAYGLKQIAIESGGKQPTARRLASVVSHARESGVRLIFVQPQFSTRGAEIIARQIGGKVVPVDPLAEDYLANLRSIGRQIDEAMQPGTVDRPVDCAINAGNTSQP